MSESYSYKDAFIHHRNSQNKFDYFFLGVILASLSLSIQSYSTKSETIYPIIIIVSWTLFLISFLAGFFRQERLNLSYMIEAERIPQKERKSMFEKADRGEIILQVSPNEEWSNAEIKKSLENVNDILSISDSYISKYNKHTLIAYQIQKWSFFYAALLYVLFKSVNTFTISIPIIITIVVIILILNFIIVKIYKHSLKK